MQAIPLIFFSFLFLSLSLHEVYGKLALSTVPSEHCEAVFERWRIRLKLDLLDRIELLGLNLPKLTVDLDTSILAMLFCQSLFDQWKVNY